MTLGLCVPCHEKRVSIYLAMVWQAVHCGNGFTKKISICFDGYSVDQEFGALVLEIFPPKKTHTISSAAVIIIWRNQYLTEKSLTIICGKSISFLVVLMKMKILKKKRCMHYAYTSNALPLFFWVFTECWVLNCA